MNRKYLIPLLLVLWLSCAKSINTAALSQEQEEYTETNGEKIEQPYIPSKKSSDTPDTNYIDLDQEPTTEINSNEFITDESISVEQEIQDLKTIHTHIIQALNKHDKEAVFKFYDSKYKNSDNISKPEMQKLVEELWENFPDIIYESKLLNIRVTDKLAVLETLDHVQGHTVNNSIITNDKGTLETTLHSITYLKKLSGMWKITNDYSIYEESSLKFGVAKDVNITFIVPELVFSGESYAAKLTINKPVGVNAVASISKEPISYPRNIPEDLFKSLSMDLNKLERIFKANLNNKNELNTATVGFTEITEDNNAKPLIILKGIATISKRTNVLPSLKEDEKK